MIFLKWFYQVNKNVKWLCSKFIKRNTRRFKNLYRRRKYNTDRLSVVVKETDVEKLKSINPHSLLILSVVENFAGEELTIISLFSPFLMAGKNINYKSNASKVEKNYTITGVTTDWNCKKGLIQTTTAVTGSRLTYFNDHQKKQTTTSESED